MNKQLQTLANLILATDPQLWCIANMRWLSRKKATDEYHYFIEDAIHSTQMFSVVLISQEGEFLVLSPKGDWLPQQMFALDIPDILIMELNS